MKHSLTHIKAGPFTIKGFYDPGTPGRYSGPPENCYPAEPSNFEVEGVSWTSPQREIIEIEPELLDDFFATFTNQDLASFALNHIETEREARGDDGRDYEPDTYDDPSYDAYADYVNDRS